MIPELGIVAIGRNEGERLMRCLDSVIAKAAAVVYVDSGSTDGSVERARAMNVLVHELDLSLPFCAARARHEGFGLLMRNHPTLRYVMFVDGDCEIVEGFMERAIATMREQPRAAVVCGRRRERHPEQTVYNRIHDLEWNTPIGETTACGGDAVMWIEAYEQVHGFDATVPACEEPELCYRLRGAGWKVFRIDAEMTLHDVNMTRFSQWWKRSMRLGYSGLDVRMRKNVPYFNRILRSSRIWALGWPATIVIAASLGGIGFGWAGAIAGGGLSAMAGPAQCLRIARKGRQNGLNRNDALAYGALLFVAKFAELSGQIRYLWHRLRGRDSRLIEYKTAEAAQEK